MHQTQKSTTIGVLAVGIAMVLGSVFAIVPASAMGWHGGNKLGLTPAQKEQARAIFREARNEARGVFSPAQREQLKAGRKLEREVIFKDVANALKLTPDQRAQIKGIREDARTKAKAVKADAGLPEASRDAQLRDIHKAAREQMKSVLTPAQQQKVGGVIRHEIRVQQPFRTVMHSLNLNKAQKAQLKGIRQQSRKAFRAMLTPAQLQKLSSFHHAHHSF